MRHADRVGGQVDGWGNAETDKERKSRSWEEKKSRLRVRCGMWGYRPVCPVGDYRWLSELNQNCADCQGMGSVTHREPHKRGVTLAQREDTEGEGFNHRVKIAFKWVFEISKNKLPLKKLNRQLICGLDEGQAQSCPPLSFLFISASFLPWHHSFSHIWFPFSHTFTHRHTPAHVQVLYWHTGLNKGQVSHLVPINNSWIWIWTKPFSWLMIFRSKILYMGISSKG